MCGWSEADLDKRCIQEGLFSIPGKLEWFNGSCYGYDRARVPDCKTDLTLSSNLTVLCDDQSASVDDDYVNNSALDVPTYVQPLRTEIVKQTICEVLNICDDQSVSVDEERRPEVLTEGGAATSLNWPQSETGSRRARK